MAHRPVPRARADSGAVVGERSSAGRRPTKRSSAAPGGLSAKLAKLGLHSRFDLVLHLPLRYEDETRLCPIRDLLPGEVAQIEGEVVRCDVRFQPRRQLRVEVEDGSGIIALRFLHFYPSQQKQFATGVRIRAVGDVRVTLAGPELIHPRYRVVVAGTPLPEALTPVYPTIAGLGQATLRRAIGDALDTVELDDTLPQSLLDELGLAGFEQSVRTLHNPPPDVIRASLDDHTHPAWTRLQFDELLALQLSMRVHYRERRARTAPVLAAGGALRARLETSLPFVLTAAQRRVLAEIGADLARPHPMQRLLQGDVGSGKTVVAALACAQAIDGGCQAALMAPTELLAEQHFRKIAAWFAEHGIETAWLAGKLKKSERSAVLERVADGSAALVVGTHALIQDEVEFAALGLAVIDEQHRFGVEQRLALRGKARGGEPHQLMMSATPIPRTLSMSYFADLDVSVIDELPPGRTPIVTRLVARSRRDEVVARVREACMEGAQAYWVCPLIEESDVLELEAATELFDELRATFPELAVGLVHGRMPAAERSAVMAAFERGELKLLVATTVIEVGVDVPDATVIVIEHAERMGLAQLHQLRGRVGRGARPGTCVLLYQAPLSDNARMRLKVIFEQTDGFEIARQDLHIRGPGEYLGARQSGAPLLRFADVERDAAWIERAREVAERLLQEAPEVARAHLERWLPRRAEYLKA